MVPTFTLTFPTMAEAAEHLSILGYSRLPVRGLIARFAATLYADDGRRYLSFACVASRHDDGSISYVFNNAFPREA